MLYYSLNLCGSQLLLQASAQSHNLLTRTVTGLLYMFAGYFYPMNISYNSLDWNDQYAIIAAAIMNHLFK
jgi:hypothetical protein